MAIDFFIEKCQTENISDPRFGICDNETDKDPAYVDRENEDKWIAVVENKTDKPINFTAVDNCIEVFRPNGSMENRCDALLTNADHIVFVELKNQGDNWIAHAVDDQLQTTIDYFKDNHDIGKYRFKRAFACNRRRPFFRVSYKEKMDAFYKKNGIRLSLEAKIIFNR